jgi:thiamine-monophosphate kinase
VLDVPAGERLVVSTDSTVEGVHFRRPWLTPEEIGWRATHAALSDLAAMGAAPLGVLLALTVPSDWRDQLPGVAEGIGDACRATGATIVGGDVTDGDRLALAITALGHTAHPLSRAGARAGDTLYVTGRLGGPGEAVRAWYAGRSPEPAHRARFARPSARLAAGQWFAAHGATAAIDLSDGLSGDAAHLAAASRVRCVLTIDSIPCVAGVSVHEALGSGEEYELLVAARAIDAQAFARENAGLELTAIGRVEAVVSGRADGVVGEERGAIVALPATFSHLALR